MSVAERSRPLPATPDDDERFFEEVQRKEFAHLEAHGETYLDFAGAAVAAESQIRAHDEMLRSRLFGNPHSEHGPSRAATEAIDAARERLLRWVGVSAATHAVVFTSNTSAAIRLVAESYPFGPGTRLVLTADNHNSVNGVREPARRAGATIATLPLDGDLRLDHPEERLRELARPRGRGAGRALLAFPAQSNFSGVRHPLRLVAVARELGIDTLLDAAAFVPSATLDLEAVPADFVTLSFYKMFGIPTGVGALVARRDALARLRRPGFAGGTVLFASSAAGLHRFRPGAEAFEDGTPNFLGIAALAPGFALLERIGRERLGRQLSRLTGELLTRLGTLRHANGAPKVGIHGPGSVAGRGATVAFNVLDRDGSVLPYEIVEAHASVARVCLRGGCFCNPGAAESAFGLTAPEIERCVAAIDARGGFGDQFDPARFRACLGAPVGALRISLGPATRRSDLHRAIDVIASFADSSRLSPARSLPAPSRRRKRRARPSSAGTSTSATSLR